MKNILTLVALLIGFNVFAGDAIEGTYYFNDLDSNCDVDVPGNKNLQWFSTGIRNAFFLPLGNISVSHKKRKDGGADTWLRNDQRFSVAYEGDMLLVSVESLAKDGRETIYEFDTSSMEYYAHENRVSYRWIEPQAEVSYVRTKLRRTRKGFLEYTMRVKQYSIDDIFPLPHVSRNVYRLKCEFAPSN